MKSLIAVILVSLQANMLVAQRPTSVEYHSTGISSDGTTLYGYSSLEGSMSGSFPRGVIRHTYTTGFSIVPPAGSGIALVSCTNSQSGDPTNNFDPTCSDNISAIGQGIYLMNLAESAVCSYAGTFFNNNGTSVYVYTPSFLNTLWSGLLSYGSVDATTGNLNNVQLSPDAFNYLKASGFIDAATLGTATTVLIEVPGVGEVVFAIAVIYITYRAVQALQTWVEARGNHDPAIVQTAGNTRTGTKDSNGNCTNSNKPTAYKWQAIDKSGWNGQIHWHWLDWNLNPTQCIWYANRLEGLNDPGPGFVLIPGTYQAP